MSIKATDVKALREKTGAGMMDCKRALVEAEGDFSKAEELLKELGLMAADNREGRATNEGRVFLRAADRKGALLELSCETDFVARNREFIDLGNKLVDIVLEKEDTVPKNELDEELIAPLKDVLSRIKENMTLKRYAVIRAESDELLVDYTHGEGRIGVFVKFKVGDVSLLDHPALKETAFDFALHVAAFAPLYLTRDGVDADYIEEQQELFKKQTENDEKTRGKPENVIDSIVKGKTNKHLSGICLMEQGFVRDEKIKCSKILADLGQEIGGSVEIADFLNYKVGGEV